MKIHELSRLTDINTETIRMYRKRGFLHPKKLDNGYYDYSMEDFASIVHLRKMREYSLTLDQISHQQHTVSRREYLDVFTERANDLDNQIRLLQDRIAYLELEKQHLENVFSYKENGADILHSTDAKIDFYDDNIFHHPFHDLFPDFYINTTISLFIPMDVLNGEIRDQIIPLKAGIGTYKFMLDRHQIKIPDNAIVIPDGRFITQMVTVSNLSEINMQQLSPMMSLAKKNHTPFISDTTAYLAFIHYENDVPYYTFRIRACIEETSSHN